MLCQRRSPCCSLGGLRSEYSSLDFPSLGFHQITTGTINLDTHTNLTDFQEQTCHGLQDLVIDYTYLSWFSNTCHDLEELVMIFPKPLPHSHWGPRMTMCNETISSSAHSLARSRPMSACTAPMQCVDLITLKNANINIINIQGRSKLMLKITNIESTARMFNHLWCSAKGFCQCWSEAILDHLVIHLTIVTVTEK